MNGLSLGDLAPQARSYVVSFVSSFVYQNPLVNRHLGTTREGRGPTETGSSSSSPSEGGDEDDEGEGDHNHTHNPTTLNLTKPTNLILTFGKGVYPRNIARTRNNEIIIEVCPDEGSKEAF